VSLRQHEFGLYQILGAKRKKVAVVILIETLLLGIVALVLGLGLGSLLSNVVGKLLMQELPFAPQSYQALYFPALNVTAIFYIIFCVLAALKNSFQVYNQSLLTLLNASQQAEESKKISKMVVFQAVLALLLLVSGYYFMIYIKQWQVMGILLSMITITSGTYLLFHNLFPVLIRGLSQRRAVQKSGLSIFTYAQLKFRMSYFTKVLGTVAMLTALAVGAITVGFGFKENIFLQVDQASYYDAYIFDATAKETQLIEQL